MKTKSLNGGKIMPRESNKTKRARAIKLCERMDKLYPAPECALNYDGNPFKLLIAVMLSAQTTDAGVNKVTPALWNKYPAPQDLACARIADVEEIIRPIGFYKNKARNCVCIAQMVLSDFAGEVPKNMTDLQKLPGVGRKTANVVLNEAFGIVEGIAVDTHVFRIAHVMRLSRAKTPAQTEQDLLKLLPRKYWKNVNLQWILFGRETCTARNPHCDICPMRDLCPRPEQQ